MDFNFNKFLNDAKLAAGPINPKKAVLEIHAITNAGMPKVTHFEKGVLKTIGGDLFSGKASRATLPKNNVAMEFLNGIITSSIFTNNKDDKLSFVKKYINDNGRRIVEKCNSAGDLLSVYTKEANGDFVTRDFVKKVVTTFNDSLKKVTKSAL